MENLTKPIHYKKFVDLTPEDIDLLKQIYRRLIVEGFMLDIHTFEDFLDAAVARGQFQGNNQLDPAWFGEEDE